MPFTPSEMRSHWRLLSRGGALPDLCFSRRTLASLGGPYLNGDEDSSREFGWEATAVVEVGGLVQGASYGVSGYADQMC